MTETLLTGASLYELSTGSEMPVLFSKFSEFWSVYWYINHLGGVEGGWWVVAERHARVRGSAAQAPRSRR